MKGRGLFALCASAIFTRINAERRDDGKKIKNKIGARKAERLVRKTMKRKREQKEEEFREHRVSENQELSFG